MVSEGIRVGYLQKQIKKEFRAGENEKLSHIHDMRIEY